MRRLLLVVLVGLVVAGCSSGEVFTFAEDDLCEWVSEDDVASFVSEAYGNAAFGRLGFWLQGSDDALGLEMDFLDGISYDDWAQKEGMQSSVANSFLNEMGWTP